MNTLHALRRTSPIGRVERSEFLPPRSGASGPRRAQGWKRGLDIGLVILGAPLWVPLMLILGACIRWLSPGPVLFRQERVGLGEQKFTCLKLRTMHLRADDGSHQRHLARLMQSDVPMKKLDGADPRLIPGAWMLRSSGLDELPQLINVLRGEMSLVGPRPCTCYEFAQFEPWHRERFKTLPGLTGLWQVSGKNRTTFTRMIELDIHYVRNCCVWLDLGILLRTFPAVLGQFLENRLDRTRSTERGAPRRDGSEAAAETRGWTVRTE